MQGRQNHTDDGQQQSQLLPNMPRLSRWAVASLFSLIAGCATGPIKDGPPDYYIDISQIPDIQPRLEPLSRYGNPEQYEVFGKQYLTLKECHGFEVKGLASWYGTKFHGRRTSSGEPYDMLAMTAAHKTLPLPCYAKVTNINNNKSIIVKINDRGPFHSEREIDLSYAAALKLGFADAGTAPVIIETIPTRPEPETHTVDAANSRIQFAQVGSFSDLERAQNLAKQLTPKLHQPIVLVPVTRDQQTLTSVRIGPIKTPEEMAELQGTLAKLAIPSTVVIIDPQNQPKKDVNS